MKIIVAGSRDFTDYSLLDRELSNLNIDCVITGLARGADLLGKKWAELNNKKILEFPAEWDKYGKSAGYKRNAQMLKEADFLIAFWDGKSKGTKNMIDIAANKIEIRIINW